MNSSRIAAYEDSVALETRQVVDKLPKRRRPSEEGIKQFAEDLTLVAVGFRMSHLVDAIVIPPDLVEPLSVKLRQLDDLFHSLVFLFASEGAQLFVINSKLLKDAYQSGQRWSWTRIVGLSVGSPPRLLSLKDVEQVDSLASRLCRLCIGQEGLSPVVHFDSEGSGNPVPATLIALAGWLLEYPFAYLPVGDEGTPESGSSDFGERLGGVQLSVFSCRLAFPDGHRRQFMKFSCPSCLLRETSNPGHSLSSLSEAIVERWRGRLPMDSACSIEVEVESKTLDRVSL